MDHKYEHELIQHQQRNEYVLFELGQTVSERGYHHSIQGVHHEERAQKQFAVHLVGVEE